MLCPICKNHYKMYAVFMDHMSWHGYTVDESKLMIARIKKEGGE